MTFHNLVSPFLSFISYLTFTSHVFSCVIYDILFLKMFDAMHFIYQIIRLTPTKEDSTYLG